MFMGCANRRRACLLFGRRGAARTGYGFGGFAATCSTKLSTEIVHRWRVLSAPSGMRTAERILMEIKLQYFCPGSFVPFFLLGIGVIPAH